MLGNIIVFFHPASVFQLTLVFDLVYLLGQFLDLTLMAQFQRYLLLGHILVELLDLESQLDLDDLKLALSAHAFLAILHRLCIIKQF